MRAVVRIYNAEGGQITIPPQQRPCETAEPPEWFGGLAVWGTCEVPFHKAETLGGPRIVNGEYSWVPGGVVPREGEYSWVWGSGENWDGARWDVPSIYALPLDWREQNAVKAAKKAAEDAEWERGREQRERESADREAAHAADHAAWIAKGRPVIRDSGSGYGMHTDD